MNLMYEEHGTLSRVFIAFAGTVIGIRFMIRRGHMDVPI